ncbi:MAG: PhzF family phenazine biosynthesis protein, partial [Erysipelotrichales bacterium]
ENGKYYVRNFAPACGIDEESATGTSNGAMYVYLRENGLIDSGQTIEFLQGDIMDSPSTIVVSTIDDKIWVGGKATINKEKHI